MSLTDDLSSLEPLIKASHLYAGIGSRATPPAILLLMAKIASVLADDGLILRSGASPGADSAFERGCDWNRGAKEIFLPWKGFNKHPSSLFTPSEEAVALAARLHPNWKLCGFGARKLHARNCQQICGEALDAPVRFVLFWAPEHHGCVEGGTATAVSLARERKIPTFNLRDDASRALWQEFLARHEEKRLRFWQKTLRSLHRQG